MKSLLLTILVIAMSVALVGCKSAEVEPPEQTETEASPITAEVTVVEESAPVEIEVKEPFRKSFSVLGLEITVAYVDGAVEITYPSTVLNEDVIALAGAAYARFPLFFENTNLAVDTGKAILTVPNGFEEEDVEAAADLLADALPALIELIRFEPTVMEYDLFGYGKISAVFDIGRAEITYPSDLIGDWILIEAAQAVLEDYPSLIDEVTFELIESGDIVLTYPEEWREEEFNRITESCLAFADEVLDRDIPFGFDPEGQGPESVKVRDILTGIEVADPEKEYFSFLGWHVSCASERYLVLANMVGSQINLLDECTVDASLEQAIRVEAEWSADVFTLSYHLNGGTFGEETEDEGQIAGEDELADVYIPDLSSIVADRIANPESYTFGNDSFILDFPVRDGYWFLGWTSSDDKNPSLIRVVDTSNPVDDEFSAVWVPVKYMVEYEAFEEKLIKQYSLESDPVVSSDPVRENYDFTGWKLVLSAPAAGKDAISVSVEGNVFVARCTSELTEDDIAKALDRILDAFSSYHLDNYVGFGIRKDGSSVDSIVISFLYEDISGLNPVVLDYCCNLIKQILSQAVTIPETIDEQDPVLEYVVDPSTGRDYVLLATWNPIVYTMSYDLGGGEIPEGFELVGEYTVEDSPIVLPEAERTGYEFKGWISDSTPDKEADTGYEFDTSYGSDVSFSAVWAPVGYSITYDKGFEGEDYYVEAENPVIYTIEDTVVLAAPTRRHYDFLGWEVVSGLNGDAETVSVIEEGNTGDIRLKALWKLTDYNVEYILNGGVIYNPNPNITSFTIKDEPFAILKNPKREHYIFVGWRVYGAELDEPQMEFTIDPVEAAGDISVEAIWEPIVYSISYNIDDDPEARFTHGVVYSYYTVETEDFVLDIPVKTNCNFLGWYLKGDPAREPQYDYTVKKGTTGDLEFIAAWEWREVPVGAASNYMKQTPVYGKNSIPRPDWVITTPSEAGFHYEKGYYNGANNFYDNLNLAVDEAMKEYVEWAGATVTTTYSTISSLQVRNIAANGTVYGREVVEYWEDSLGGVWVLIRVPTDR